VRAKRSIPRSEATKDPAPQEPRSPALAPPRRSWLLWLELIVVSLFLACWVVFVLDALGVVHLAGALPLQLYPFFSLAASLGWGAGLGYNVRRRNLAGAMRRRALVVYYFGPPGILHVVRAMAPLALQRLQPLVPILAWGVYSVFFTVPLVVAPRRRL